MVRVLIERMPLVVRMIGDSLYSHQVPEARQALAGARMGAASVYDAYAAHGLRASACRGDGDTRPLPMGRFHCRNTAPRTTVGSVFYVSAAWPLKLRDVIVYKHTGTAPRPGPHCSSEVACRAVDAGAAAHDIAPRLLGRRDRALQHCPRWTMRFRACRGRDVAPPESAHDAHADHAPTS